MKKFTSKTQKTGELGEQLAERFLISKGFAILERNATYQGGEIDIVAKKEGKIHFIEVKTIKVYVSASSNVFHVKHLEENGKNKGKGFQSVYNPFQNVSQKKIHKMAQSALIWLSKYYVSSSSAIAAEDKLKTPWQLDAIGVFLNQETKKATISYIPNINI